MHVSSVKEPKSHRSLPIHLPLHTEWRVTWEGSSSDKLYKSVFSGITGQVVVTLVKLATKTHSAAAGYFSQLHRYAGPPFWFRMNSIGLHRKAKTAIKATKATHITISYKHTVLIYKEKYKFNVYIVKWSLRIHCGENAAVDENLESCGKQSS